MVLMAAKWVTGLLASTRCDDWHGQKRRGVFTGEDASLGSVHQRKNTVVLQGHSHPGCVQPGEPTVSCRIAVSSWHWRATTPGWHSVSIRVAQLWHTHGALGRWLRCIHRHRRVWKLQQRQQLTFAVLPVFFCFIRRRKFVMRRSGVRFISPAPRQKRVRCYQICSEPFFHCGRVATSTGFCTRAA